MEQSRVHPLFLEEEVMRYAYLITEDACNILIDPGAFFHAERLIKALQAFVNPNQIDYIILQSNDILNITAMEKLIAMGFQGTLIVNETTIPYMQSLYQVQIKTIEELDYVLRLENNVTFHFLTMPFLPFPDCYATFYHKEKTFFSNHFLSQAPHEQKGVKNLIASINAFHELILPSVDFIRFFSKKLIKIPIETVYPRLGYPIVKDEIETVLREVVLFDFYNTKQMIQQNSNKKTTYNFEAICNHMLRRLATAYHRHDIVDVFSGSAIEIGLYPQLEISQTSLYGLWLWNGFFDIIYQKKGATWLAHLEPIVNRYYKSYKVPKPEIYKAKTVEQSLAIQTLQQDKVSLEGKVLDLSNKIMETTDKLLRCPITGLYNQRFMMQHLLNNLPMTLEKNQSRYLIALQIDDFMRINKLHGASVGDDTLRHLVYVINQVKKEDTILFKQNGPGLFIYKHQTDKKQILEFIKKLRNEIKNATVFVEAITISMSLVSKEELNSKYPVPDQVNQMIEMAQSRLERAKQKGKDQFLDKDSDEEQFIEGFILLVDEDETYQNLMVTIFKRMNYQVIVAADVYQAFELLENNHVDIVISEINLSKLDGFQLKQRMNAVSTLKDIPFIITSHFKNLDVITRCNLLNIDLVLKKPIVPEELLGHVKRIQDRRVKL
ncbi:MAG: response regulator [Bacilli bacterium]|jgi:diguanylate cyclase (GGDEF)-like protein|nr:response regulator [Bacilli bacterium]